jgi:hypothetical protein
VRAAHRSGVDRPLRMPRCLRGDLSSRRVDPRAPAVVDTSGPAIGHAGRQDAAYAEPIGLLERIGARFTRMSSVRAAIPAGDFRDWPAIEAWAEGIARDLHPAPTAAGVPA